MNRYAVLIGNNNFPIDAGFQDLRCPGNDVDGMYEILADNKYGGFNEPVKLKNCNTADIKREMGKILKRVGRDDLILVYYSGHGKQDLEGQLYLATADTYAASPIELMSTGLPISDIRNLIRNSNANRVILILDCCYSGAIGIKGSDPNVVLANIDEGRGTYILTASTSLQTAQEKEEDQYGLLTKHIIGGIRTGDADKDNDGVVSMDDLYHYVFEMVRKDGPQTPMQWALNVQGRDLSIASVFREALDNLPMRREEAPIHVIELDKLEPPGGVVRLNSPFYISRHVDDLFLAAIRRKDVIVLVKGARQMGKTSLLSRGLQLARTTGAKTAVTDFQVLGFENLETLRGFYIALGTLLSEKLGVDLLPEDIWNDKRGSTINFRKYIENLLKRIDGPLVWGMDEVDRLFTRDYGSEVFALFRSWHSESGLDPDSPLKHLTMVISYATEASLFISDPNQSPFNVGTRLVMDDFTKEQVSELNRRHNKPLINEDQLNRFHSLLGGQPFLTRSGLYVLASEDLRFSQFEAVADEEDGPFGDHLRRFIELLYKDPGLKKEVRDILLGNGCTRDSFYRLRSAGLMKGESPQGVKPRCELYKSYLERHLL